MAQLTDLLQAFAPGSGAGGGLTAEPGTGLKADPNAPRSLTAPSAIMQVPNFEGPDIHDIMGQSPFSEIGGQQQGGLGDRLGGILGSGFADPTVSNIARAIGLGLSIASPLSPLGLAEGAILSQANLPGYASPILSAIASSVGLPGPISLADFQGAGAFPQDLVAKLQAAVPYSSEWYNLQSQLQQYAQAHETGAGPFGTGQGQIDIGSRNLATLAGQGLGVPGTEIGTTLTGGLQAALGGGGGGNMGGMGSGPSQGDPSGAHGTPGMGVG